MASEVSKTISRGLHKQGVSIRDLVLRSSAVNQLYSLLTSAQTNLLPITNQDNAEVMGALGHKHHKTTIHEETDDDDD
jgi:hypothetical protein